MNFFLNTNIQFYFFAYFVGSIPFGLLLAHYFAGVNIATSGSQSVGATNVLRVVKEVNPSLAKKLAIATLLLDALKGIVVILIAKLMNLSIETIWAVAVFSVIGHCYPSGPVFQFLKRELGLGFLGKLILVVAKFLGLDTFFTLYTQSEGGKGVATGAGVLLVMLPLETLIAFVTWFVAGKVLKISSLSSLLALSTLMISAYVLHPTMEGINSHAPLWIIAFIIVYKHLPNILRLIQGKEGKVV